MAHEDAYLKHLEAQGVSVLNLRDIENLKEHWPKRVLPWKVALRQSPRRPWQTGDGSGGRMFCGESRGPASSASGLTKSTTASSPAKQRPQRSFSSRSIRSSWKAFRGVLPESMYVVPPGVDFQPEQYRVLDFAAYYRFVKARLERAIEQNRNGITTFAEPTAHCEICRWWQECDAEWRKHDHLSLVAGINRLQRKQLSAWEVTTVGQLAVLPLPIQNRPDHGTREGYVKVREQARVQVAGRKHRQPVHEVFEVTEEHGLSLLPEPSPGDVFFDLEGDPFVGLGGREYLFGFAARSQVGRPTTVDGRSRRSEEKQAFEWFVDPVMARWADYPAMHIYHFSPYEPSALKRLMGSHATREDEIDRMLRARLFIDLHTVLKRAARASVEQYSLKALEVFHGFERKVPLEEARKGNAPMEHALELGQTTEVDESVSEKRSRHTMPTIASRHDRCAIGSNANGSCWSKQGTSSPGQHCRMELLLKRGERQRRTAALAEALKRAFLAIRAQRDEEQAARWLLCEPAGLAPAGIEGRLVGVFPPEGPDG